MKNIHILSSEKPSRLYVLNIYIGLRLSKTDISKGDIHTPKNIYITSDEEIKDCNCYVINAVGVLDKMNVFKPIKVTEEIVRKEPLITYPNGGWCKKIILTTDEDLIKDGVQAIDDDFLEWFIKNPSCEEVSFIIRSAWLDNGLIIDSYQITIPKEEPRQEMPWLPKENFDKYHKLKQETLEEVAEKTKGKELFKKSNDRARKLLSEIELLPIAETLEEVSEKYASSKCTPPAIMHKGLTDAVKFGAKWQQEQDKNKFSKEDMIEAFHAESRVWSNRIKDWKEVTFSEWFEQFKKK